MATQTSTTAVLADARARQVGPVTQAIRAIQGEEPAMPPEWLADLAAGCEALAEVRRRIEARIEHDLALLDALDGDAECEDGGDAEPSLGSLGGTAGSRGCSQLRWSRGGDNDREDGDDTGIGDTGGLAEQRGRFLRVIDGGAR